MALIESLLTAIVRSDGDALVMHVGEKPYVVASAGPIELSTQGLNLEAMAGMIAQLLPEEQQRALIEFGAVEHELPSLPATQGDRFTLVAARGGDDVWIEMRRHRRPRVAAMVEAVAHSGDAEAKPTTSPGATSPATPEDVATAPIQPSAPVAVAAEAPHAIEIQPAVIPVASVEAAAPSSDAASSVAPVEPLVSLGETRAAVAGVEPQVSFGATSAAPAMTDALAGRTETTITEPAVDGPTSVSEGGFVAPEAITALQTIEPEPQVAESVTEVPTVADAPSVVAETPAPAETPMVVDPRAGAVSAGVQEQTIVEEIASIANTSIVAGMPGVENEATLDTDLAAHPLEAAAIGESALVAPVAPVHAIADVREGASVIPITRPSRIEVAQDRTVSGRPGIERLLSIAAARGASALYLTSQAPPCLRFDGDVRVLDGEPSLSSHDVESAVLALTPETTGDAVRRGDFPEWVSDFAEIGRVRCSTFRDHRGPGAIFQLIAVRPLSAEQLGLGRDVQALATETEGLVVVTSPRGAGKSTLVGAFIDLINRQRNNYVITIERQIRMLHENRNALISQREASGTVEEAVALAQSALRENPDVLVIDDLPSPEMFQVALDAAGSGILVFVTLTSASTTAALTGFVDVFPPDRHKAIQWLLSERLRGAIAQVLLRKTGGGRVAARELLLTTTSVAAVLADGLLLELPLALESGRKHGMTPLNDALLGFVRSGVVDAREAYRKADDREGLLKALKREGVYASLVERLA